MLKGSAAVALGLWTAVAATCSAQDVMALNDHAADGHAVVFEFNLARGVEDGAHWTQVFAFDWNPATEGLDRFRTVYGSDCDGSDSMGDAVQLHRDGTATPLDAARRGRYFDADSIVAYRAFICGGQSLTRIRGVSSIAEFASLYRGNQQASQPLASPPPTELAGKALVMAMLEEIAAEAEDYEVGITAKAFDTYTREGYYHDFTWTLRPNTPYVVIGVCDENCRDVDLAVRVEDEDFLEDLGEPDEPVVTFETGASGQAWIKFSLRDCGADTCHMGYRIFEMTE